MTSVSSGISPTPNPSPPRLTTWLWAGALSIGLLGMALTGGSTLGGCGGPHANQCGPSVWEGTCDLETVTLVRESELPAPHMVYEALYAPRVEPGQEGYSPQEVRVEHAVTSRHVDALQDHLRHHAQVSCRTEPPPPGTCVPGPLQVTVPPFQPGQVTRGSFGPQGCEKLEASQSANIVGTPIPEIFQFEKGSDATTPTTVQLAAQVAAKMRASPNVECVGIVGQTAPGEDPALAQTRAQAILQLLTQQGIDPKRLTTMAASVSVYGGSSAPSYHRVTLRVLLQGGSR